MDDQKSVNEAEGTVLFNESGRKPSPELSAASPKCPNCGGRGAIRIHSGAFRTTEGCEDCGGTGRLNPLKGGDANESTR